MSVEYVVVVAVLGVILGGIAGAYGAYTAAVGVWKKAFEEESASHLADVKHYSSALRYIVSLQRFSHEEFSRLIRISDGKEQYTPDEEYP